MMLIVQAPMACYGFVTSIMSFSVVSQPQAERSQCVFGGEVCVVIVIPRFLYVVCSPEVQFQLLHSKYHLCSASTRGLLLSTYIKFINLFPEIKSSIQEVGILLAFPNDLVVFILMMWCVERQS